MADRLILNPAAGADEALEAVQRINQRLRAAFGDLDIVMGEDYSGNHVYWWENPLPTGDPRRPWRRLARVGALRRRSAPRSTLRR